MVPGEKWHVLLAKGETTMSLDELDAAFQDGRVDANTLVKPPDAKLWTRLGPLAGLDETPPPWSAALSANVEIDVDVDLEDMPSASRSKTRFIVAAAAVVATIAGVAFIASGESPVTRVASASKSAANAMVIATSPTPAPSTPVVASLAAPAPTQTAQPQADPPSAKKKTKKTRDKSM
ncbi:MAG TPA: hypothetical protein VIF62_12035, partial [Labilithrix sp.]